MLYQFLGNFPEILNIKRNLVEVVHKDSVKLFTGNIIRM